MFKAAESNTVPIGHHNMDAAAVVEDQSYALSTASRLMKLCVDLESSSAVNSWVPIWMHSYIMSSV